MKGRLEGKWAIVTGGNSGIGREAAQSLAAEGASVIIASRNIEAGKEAEQSIKQRHPGAHVEYWKLDLGSQADVRKFAEDFKAYQKPLHILIANAGANFVTKRKTEDGVPVQCQVNYLGHYTLARLLQPILVASAPSRIVSVSSATHRYGAIRDPSAFLHNPKDATYADTKLAQVLFTYEAQRRLGHLGVSASAVDPGGVKTGVWKGRYAKPPFSWYINTFLSPSSVGAVPVLHAATVDYGREAQKLKKQRLSELRFYAKGAFAAPFLTWLPGPTKKNAVLDFLKDKLVMVAIGIASAVDWPVERFSKGKFFSRPTRVSSVNTSYDLRVAKELWDQSAVIAKIPADQPLLN